MEAVFDKAFAALTEAEHGMRALIQSSTRLGTEITGLRHQIIVLEGRLREANARVLEIGIELDQALVQQPPPGGL